MSSLLPHIRTSTDKCVVSLLEMESHRCARTKLLDEERPSAVIIVDGLTGCYSIILRWGMRGIIISGDWQGKAWRWLVLGASSNVCILAL